MIANQLVEKALQTAQGAQAIVQRTDSTDVAFDNDRLKSARSSQRTVIEVKVVLDGKMGTSSTTDLHDLDGVVSRALETAQFGSPVRFQFPGPRPATEVRLYDESMLDLTRSEMIAAGEEMIALVKEYNSDILVGAEIGKALRHTEFANSSGTTFSTDSTSLEMEAWGVLIRGTDVLQAWHAQASRARDVDHAALAQKAIHWFRLAENSATVGSDDMPVILTPSATSILLLTLWLGLDGKNVLLGASPLADKVGRQIADSRFSLVDDPLIDFAADSSRYDGEGVPRQRTHLIEDGMVRHFLYDLDTAARAGALSSGHGPDREPTNLLIPPGDTPYHEMLASIEEGLLVQDVLGLGQGNPINGEFSVNVGLGYKIEKGKVVGRVKDVMLAGNVYDALNDIVAIGDEAEWLAGRVTGRFPYVQIGKLSVVAK